MSEYASQLSITLDYAAGNDIIMTGYILTFKWFILKPIILYGQAYWPSIEKINNAFPKQGEYSLLSWTLN